MQRRDVLKGATLALIAGTATGQVPEGPFSLPTAKFDKANQHRFPPWAFRTPLAIPLVPRPTAIGRWDELTKSVAPFGPGDTTKLGECFHGIAREWGETPPHWAAYGCDPTKVCWESWLEKEKYFLKVPRHDNADLNNPDPNKMIVNWGGGLNGLPIKCYKIPVVETFKKIRNDASFDARLYSYSGSIPGPMLKMRLGQPVVVRFENHLETEISIHLHGGHSPSHSDGFPSFYVLQGKARDYFYPNMLPLYEVVDKDIKKGTGKYKVDVGESQSTMWYHDHAMDATAYNASKGLAGVAPCFGEEELKLIKDGVLPSAGEASLFDPELMKLEATEENPDPKGLEHPDHPGFYRHEALKEPYYNPYDVPLVLQDRVIDLATGQIAYDGTGHNGYIGDTMLVNGVAWPKLDVQKRKYRFRILDGSNARVFRLRLIRADKFHQLNTNGIDPAGAAEEEPAAVAARPASYEEASENFLRIGKDSWLWSEAVEMKSIVLMMANRADIVVDFKKLTGRLAPNETAEYFLVNTMPQFDGRGPKAKLENGGDPRVLPVPFDVVGVDGVPDARLVEVNRPIPLMKFVVTGRPVEKDATVEQGTKLIQTHRPIEDHEIKAVREFIFHRGKGAWQINGRFYDPTITNAGPWLDHAEEWVLRNGGGGWWHPIHIHLESHQLISYEKDFAADAIVDRQDPPTQPILNNLKNIADALPERERMGLHDTQALGPNTVARIRMRHRTWSGPFVFHCHNLEHEDMRMMFNFEPVPSTTGSKPEDLLPNIVPTARTHGNDVTLNGGKYIGELPWEYSPVPETPTQDSAVDLIPSRQKKTAK